MPDYHLEGLSTRTFEQLVQALAQKHIGPRAVIFGEGADGAREAEFRGVVKLPPNNEAWHGHLIVQAKFLQRPKSTPKRNTDWLISQLEKEMKKFEPRTSRSRKLVRAPDYYLIATNIYNSGVARTGGKDRLTSALDGFKAKLGWKDWILWDGAEISRMLDGAADIRTSYSAWITSGDVLTEMLNQLRGGRPDFQRTMLSRLQEDFCDAQYAKLRQAGHGGEDKTPLSRLFVDLPITRQQNAEPPEEPQPPQKLETFLESLLEKGNFRLSPSAIPIRTAESEWLEGEVVDPKIRTGNTIRKGNRIVLLGGPGQGKTTLGQFACQLYRAALLKDCDRSVLSPETKDALKDFLSRCETEASRIRARRYPVWIDVKQLAKWLAELNSEPPPSLLTFVAARLGPSVQPSDLDEWLTVYPWFIVFDGLDEVPPSSGRDQMLKSIQSFVTHAGTLNADLLVLCTTRPQGYSGDFDERYYDHRWLAPLSPDRALAYGEKLLDSRYGKAGDDRRRFGDRLSQALANETTARVMRSPLQVTIMAALVERVGKPPEQRWKLFREYYDVIYERERERGTGWSDALTRYDTEVGAIHRRVGWRLQVRSEIAKNSDARLSAAEFEAEVRAELEREGHVDTELESLVGVLSEAATDRLVFLVALGSQEIGFEIRSLQEFMAADHLFKHGDEVASRLLRRIAPSVYWRNVFLFAAGRIFAERRNLRDNLIGTLAQLNEDTEQPAAKHTLAGSLLALDILEDGSANHIPNSRDTLMRMACRLLDIALPWEHRRLAEIGIRCGTHILKEELQRRLTGDDQGAKLAAYRSLVLMLGRIEWATELLEKFRRNGGDDTIFLSKCLDEPRFVPASERPHLFKHFEAFVCENSPFENVYLYRFNAAPGILSKLGRLLQESRVSTINGLVGKRGLRLGLGLTIPRITSGKSISLSLNNDEALSRLHPDWQVLLINTNFLSDPSANQLAKSLEHLSQVHSWPLGRRLECSLAWPLAMVVSHCSSWNDVEAVAARIRSGGFGDIDQWKRFEVKCLNDSIDVDELTEIVSGKVGRPNKIREAGSTCGYTDAILISIFANCRIVYLNEELKAAAHSAIDRFVSILVEHYPSWAIHLIGSLTYLLQPIKLSVSTFLRVAQSTENRRLLAHQSWLEEWLLEQKENVIPSKYNELGFAISAIWEQPLRERTVRAVHKLVDAITKHPQRTGLWRILSLMPPLPDQIPYSELIRFLPKPSDPESKADALALRVGGRMWTRDSAKEIAVEIIEALKLRPDLLSRLAEVLDSTTAVSFAFESLPAALVERMRPDDLENRPVLYETLQRMHLKRPSGLCESDDEKQNMGG